MEDELAWLHQCLLHPLDRPRTTYTVNDDGWRYLALLPYLQERGREIAERDEEAMVDPVYLQYPQFALDRCILHGDTNTDLALRVLAVLCRPKTV